VQCSRCGKKLGRFGSPGVPVTLESGEKEFCTDCFWELRKEYDRRKTCDGCMHFEEDFCSKINRRLTPITIGMMDYFIQAERCVYYITNEEYEKKAITGKIGLPSEKGTCYVTCEYCEARYDANKNTKCPNCGGPPPSPL